MFVRSVVCLVEDEQANVAPKLDVAMAECVEEYVGRADDDATRWLQHAKPHLPVLPLVWFVLARNQPNRDGDVHLDDIFLLPRKRDSRCKEPGDLNGGEVGGHTA